MAVPHASQGPMPNSSRKRRPLADLTRPSASPSRSNAMATIFNDAALSLRTPSSPCSPNSKRSRIPLAQARSIRFGSMNQDHGEIAMRTGSPIRFGTDGQADSILSTTSTHVSHSRPETPAEVPYGTRFPTPLPVTSSPPFLPLNVPEQEQFDQIQYPVLDQWNVRRASQTLSPDSEDEECHSTHGVPFILPLRPANPIENKESSVNEWLEEVLMSSSTQPTNPEQTHDQDSPFPVPAPESTDHLEPAFFKIPSTPPTYSLETPSKHTTKDRRTSASSNKENQPPTPSISSPPLRPLTTRFLSAHLSRFGISPPPPSSPKPSPSATPPSNPLKRLPRPSPRRPPRTPPGPLTQPPKRQKAASTGKTKPHAVPILDSKPTFTIVEDETATPPYAQETEEIGEGAGGRMGMVQLSPEVEVGRKGRGRAKRDRCASYWDEDIIGRGDIPE